MSQDILQILIQTPEEIFTLGKKNESSTHFNELVKSYLDPITKSHSVLDEIYVDGLDASQVFGQTKMVLDGVGESLLFEKIPELKEKYAVEEDSEEEEEEVLEEEEEEEVLEEEEEEEEEVLEEEEQDEEEVEDEEELDDQFQSAEEDNFEVKAEKEEVEEEEEESSPSTSTTVKKDVFGLNDGFFDIDEFNRQSLALENDEEEEDNDEEIDFFADLSDEDDEDEEAGNMEYYDDFYDKPGQDINKRTEKVSKNDSEEEEEEEEEFDDNEYENAMGSAMLDLFDEEDDEPKKKKNSENLSSFEKQQQQIQDEIAKLEAELVADKKWSMKGEVAAKDRPQDSLLDDTESNNLEFERTAKPVPVITQEVTESLEDMIRRRIKEENFDDLPKRLVNDVASFHNRQKFELSEQKSSKSLAELYEDDYKGTGESTQVGEISADLQKQHDEISSLFASVTHKLDSLCSAHFIPKPHQFKQVEIKVNDTSSSAAASISMEDAQPLHISSDTALAPQEVYKVGDDKPKQAVGREGKQEVQLRSGLSYSKDELSREDKQRLRRASKRKRSKEFNQRKEIKEQREKQEGKTSTKDGENGRKRARVGEVIDTLSRAKNITVIGKKGEMTDVKGQKKKNGGPKGSSGFKL